MAEAREVAYAALRRVEENDAYSNIVLDTLLEESGLSGRDKSFCAKLFYGVLENKLLLDYNIAVRSDRSVHAIDRKVIVLLRMGLYQLFLMDSVTNAAAVNETVRLCRQNGLDKAAGFVNALLRKAAADQQLRTPDPKKGKNKYLSVRYSCPETIVKLWRESYGDDVTIGLLKSLAERPPLSVRVNTLHTDAAKLTARLAAEGVHAELSAWDDNALLLQDTGAVERLASFQEGDFHVQDMASQLCCRFLDPQPGETVFDVCAAPGGKSFTCAERMCDRGRIMACDLYEARLGLVQNGAQRLGIHIINTKAGDAAALQSDTMADRVLCDVPCSGLGILRRKPELRYKDDLGLSALPELQYRILCRAASFVRSGGRLLYSTCTLHPRENHDNVQRFLAEHEDFVPCPLSLPEGMTRGISEPDNELTLLPPLHGTDGFFISMFQRK